MKQLTLLSFILFFCLFYSCRTIYLPLPEPQRAPYPYPREDRRDRDRDDDDWRSDRDDDDDDDWGKGKKHKKDKDYGWKKGKDKDDYRTGGRSIKSLGIPKGHLPPPGACKVWYRGTPPGHQPSAQSCNAAFRRAKKNSWVIERINSEKVYVYSFDRGRTERETYWVK